MSTIHDMRMRPLKRFIVPVELVVLSESETDARQSVIDELEILMHECDSIVGFEDEIDIEDISEQEL